jgi:uncharacterized membrane protein
MRAKSFLTEPGCQDPAMFAHWAQTGPAILSAFLASLVECIEALTIVLAVGAVRGWRGALTGAFAALAVLLALVVALGPALTRIPLAPVQIVVGGLALWFGLRWLRKAVRRAAGTLPLRDETRAFARETARLRHDPAPPQRWDREALATSFRVTMLEGIEVVFIVLAIGATGPHLLGPASLSPASLGPASLGAASALVTVMLLGLILHRPVANIPENTLKLAVGIMLCAFGAFWLGEGVHLPWPGHDLALIGLIALFSAGAMAAIGTEKNRSGGQGRPPDQDVI